MLGKVDDCNQNLQINFNWVLQVVKLPNLATLALVWYKILLPILAENNIFFSEENSIKVRPLA